MNRGEKAHDGETDKTLIEKMTVKMMNLLQEFRENQAFGDLLLIMQSKDPGDQLTRSFSRLFGQTSDVVLIDYVYARRGDPSPTAFRFSLHRHPYISVFSLALASSIYNKQTSPALTVPLRSYAGCHTLRRAASHAGVCEAWTSQPFALCLSQHRQLLTSSPLAFAFSDAGVERGKGRPKDRDED